jgi:hypothetical protein
LSLRKGAKLQVVISYGYTLFRNVVVILGSLVLNTLEQMASSPLKSGREIFDPCSLP